MSYRHIILSDYPSSFYMLDEVVSASTLDYDELMSNYTSYQDLKDNGVSYAYINGTPIYDYSGNNNDGVAVQASTSKILPLVPGSIRGTEIKEDTAIRYVTSGFANSGYKNNAFSFEFWFRPPSSNSTEIPLVADIATESGVYYSNGFIYFRLLGKECYAKIETHKSYHVVAVYTSESILLYLNGLLVSNISTGQYSYFENDFTSFQSGPSSNLESFVIDCVAFYRYVLSESQISSHHIAGNYELDYGQIVYPEKGTLFSLNASKLNVVKKYSYPFTKKWTELASGDAVVSPDQSYITFLKTEAQDTASFSFTDEIFVPDDIAGSFLSYSPNLPNISVEISLNGVSDWTACSNYSSLPFFNKETYAGNSRVFIRVSMESDDTSLDIPVLNSVDIDFYSDVKYYADNSGDVVESEYDYNLSQFNERLLSQNRHNGLSMNNGGGFDVQLSSEFSSIELIYTPGDLSNVLFSEGQSVLKWSADGTITASGINYINVNGVDVTNETNAFSYLVPGYPHYVFVSLSSPSQNVIKFNYDSTGFGTGSLFSNIAVYPGALTEESVLRHFNMYIGSSPDPVDAGSAQVLESITGNDETGYSIYDIDWQRSTSA